MHSAACKLQALLHHHHHRPPVRLHQFPVKLFRTSTSICLQDGPSPYPQLFTHLQHPTFEQPAGARSVVADLKGFKRNFHHLSEGLFKGVDWSNMVVAGVLHFDHLA
jgi:hypothetical protein